MPAEVRPGAGNRIPEIRKALYSGRAAVLPYDGRSRFLCQSCGVPACASDRRNL
ncbi:hypothetical protein DW806_10310 [Butyricicoccus sp. AM32-19]|nr:hypothetical protein DW806_10310 [Butyricicoccus sp. AM32-19]RHV80341.1 hypothetical protein DXB00_13185 [Butyricicoccus sp. OF10-2]